MQLRRPLLFLGLLWLISPVARAVEAPASDPEVGALLKDYIGLYTEESLERWRELFLPGFIATSTNEDGSVTTRSLDEFYERQRKLFGPGKSVSEALENTRVERAGKLAVVRSDFVWKGGAVTRHGRLMMLLIAERGRLKIQALTFSYNG